MDKKEVVKHLKASPGYAKIVQEVGIETADDYVNFKAWFTMEFRGTMIKIAAQNTESFANCEDNFESIVKTLDNNSFDAFLWGAWTYRAWIGKKVVVLDLEKEKLDES